MDKLVFICLFVSVFVFILISFEYILVDKNIKFTSIDLKGYTQFKEDSKNWVYTAGGIPKIIIKTSWQSINNLPVDLADVLKQNQEINKDYELYYFSDSDVDSFMSDYSQEVYTHYKKLVPGAFKADYFRVCILEKYGGVYSDIGHTFLVSLDKILLDYNMVLVKDIPFLDNLYNGIFNAFMCTVPNNPFFKEVVNKITQNIKINYYGESSHDITGPVMIGKVFSCYFENNCELVDIVKVGESVLKGLKIRILQNKFLWSDFRNTTYIVDENYTKFVNTKFKKYYYIMYRASTKPKYTALWNQRKVYK